MLAGNVEDIENEETFGKNLSTSFGETLTHGGRRPSIVAPTEPNGIVSASICFAHFGVLVWEEGAAVGDGYVCCAAEGDNEKC